MVIAASITGPITSSSQAEIAPAQEKTGIRRQAMPGARIVRRVETRSTAMKTKPSVASPAEASHTSTPLLGVKASRRAAAAG